MTDPCPRCHQQLVTCLVKLEAGPSYRTAATPTFEALRCDRCSIGVVPGTIIRELMGVDVGGKLTERDRKKTRYGCPTAKCFANLDQVTLTWEADSVEVEQCARCGLMVFDPGEFPKVFAIERLG